MAVPAWAWAAFIAFALAMLVLDLFVMHRQAREDRRRHLRPKTAAAARAFQRAMSIEVPSFAVDGIVGPQTWQALVTEALSG